MRIAQVKINQSRNPHHFKIPDSIELNDQVIVKTPHGLEVGFINKIKEDSGSVSGLNFVERKMNTKDFITQKNILDQEYKIKAFVMHHIQALKLKMNLIQIHLSFDETYLLVEYESEQRIDFRDLVRIISNTYHTRTEMKQIGPRDVARVKGGIGPCGLILCCSSFIGEFDSISIKMAKNQSLSLNPQNISGLCGKLLCCIKYEDETYNYLKENMPSYGSKFQSEHGEGKVIDINYISQKVKIKHLDGNIEWYSLKSQTK